MACEGLGVNSAGPQGGAVEDPSEGGAAPGTGAAEAAATAWALTLPAAAAAAEEALDAEYIGVRRW